MVNQVNYLLRGLDIPSGNHTVEFTYADEHYTKYNNYAMFGSLIMLLLAGGGVFLALRKKKEEPTVA
jgi:LPXTG-motif cell wall-anchored protein